MPGYVLKLQVVVQVMPLLVVLKQDRRVGRVLACRAEEVDVQHAEGFVVLEDAPGVGQDVVHVHDDLRGGWRFWHGFIYHVVPLRLQLGERAK